MPKILFTKKVVPSFTKPIHWESYDFIEPLGLEPKQTPSYDNIIITSVRGVDYALPYVKKSNLKFFTVGQKAANKLQNLGKNVLFCAKDANELISEIPKNQCYTYLASQKHLPTIPNSLGANIEVINTYTVGDKTVKFNQVFTAYVFFSPSGIDSFKNQYTIPDNCTIFTLGNTTRNHLYKVMQRDSITPLTPNLESVCRSIENFYFG